MKGRSLGRRDYLAGSTSRSRISSVNRGGRVLRSSSTPSLERQDLHSLRVQFGQSSKIFHYGEPMVSTTSRQRVGPGVQE